MQPTEKYLETVKNTYNSSFKELVYGELPTENKIL